MNNDIEFETFQIEAKKIFHSAICQGKILNWEEWYQQIMNSFELQEKEVPNLWKTPLYQWWSEVAQISFLTQIIDKYPLLEEIHLLGCEQAMAHSEGNKKLISIENLSQESYQLALEIICLRFHQNWNSLHPFSSFHLNLREKNFRLTLVHKTLTANNQSLACLRSSSSKTYSIEEWDREDSPQSSLLIKELINDKKNILIAGPTGSGKTTFLRSLIEIIPKHERLLILEDTHELHTSHPLASHLIASNEDGKRLKDYCAYSLRLTPERLLLGEIRSGEVVPFLLSMNTGHNGLMATVHANSARDAISRLALLFMLYNEQRSLDYNQVIGLICQGLDNVIYIENKKIKEVIKILGHEKGEIYFEKEEEGEKSPSFLLH